MNLPGELNGVLARWLEGASRGGLASASVDLSLKYRAGETSRDVSLAAYVAARVPATFAANVRVLEALLEVMPAFTPRSLLDVGAGPGVASWAALAQWPALSAVTQIEHDPKFAALARQLNDESGLAALVGAEVRREHLASFAGATADLVLASYVLAELPLARMAETADVLWTATGQSLVIIEPGTPQGFARLRTIRDYLLKRGAHVVAPCTHAAQCPMAGDDWCHFKVRLARSRAHMHAKGAIVPFEDEAFSYLVFSREAVPVLGARIVAPPEVMKGGVDLQLCGAAGLSTDTIARRDKASYKRAKHSRWGDLWT